MIPMYDLVLLSIFSGFFSDMSFILKIFLLVAVLGFLNQHIENKTLKVIVAIFMVYIVIFVDWATFGWMYLIYAVLGLGISSIFVDFFFITNMNPEEKGGGHQGMMPGMGGMQGMEPEMEHIQYEHQPRGR